VELAVLGIAENMPAVSQQPVHLLCPVGAVQDGRAMQELLQILAAADQHPSLLQ
jgi:hypothetical protein